MFTASGQIVNANMSSGGLQTAKELVKIREERKGKPSEGGEFEEHRERTKRKTRSDVKNDYKHENDYSVVAGVVVVQTSRYPRSVLRTRTCATGKIQSELLKQKR